MPAYQPSGSESLTGSVRDVKASYTPPGNSTQTQIRTTTVGRLMMSEPVSSYISNAFRLELRGAGVKMGDGTCEVTLVVNDYAMDDLGFNATYISDISYELKAEQPIFRKNVKIAFTTDKFVVPEVIFASLRSALAQNFDDVMKDQKFKSALSSSCAGPVGKPVA